MHIHEIEELELNANYERPGAAEARLHNQWEGYWEALEAGEDVLPPDYNHEAEVQRIEDDVLAAKFGNDIEKE